MESVGNHCAGEIAMDWHYVAQIYAKKNVEMKICANLSVRKNSAMKSASAMTAYRLVAGAKEKIMD